MRSVSSLHRMGHRGHARQTMAYRRGSVLGPATKFVTVRRGRPASSTTSARTGARVGDRCAPPAKLTGQEQQLAVVFRNSRLGLNKLYLRKLLPDSRPTATKNKLRK